LHKRRIGGAYGGIPMLGVIRRADVEAGLKTITDHYAELGADFREEIERRGADAKLILETAAKYGVPPEMLWKAAAGLLNPHHDPR
jgi:hypothetical protein